MKSERANLREKTISHERNKKQKGDNMKTQKVKLMDIVIDPNIQVREVNPHTASQYAQAMRAGDIFPPLLLEKGSNRCVCGNNRYSAYKKVFSPDYEVDVFFKTFKNEAEIIKTAAKDNVTHGLPLGTWDKKRIALRLLELGSPIEEIAETLSVSIKKIMMWNGMTVCVVGGKEKSKLKAPVKHGLEHMAGKQMKESEYLEHSKRDPGQPVKNLAAVITRHIQNNWIDTEDVKTMENLKTLYIELSNLLNRKVA